MRLIRKPAFVTSEGLPHPRTVLHYQTYDESDAATVRQGVLFETPANVVSIYGNLLRGEVSLNQTFYNQFDVDIEYARKGDVPPKAGEYSWDFDAAGITEHITHSLSTVNAYPGGTAACPNFKNAIGVEHGEVKGCDVVSPQSSLIVKYTHPFASFSLSYARFVGNLVGYVNSTPFLGVWPAGEVRFMGLRGSDGTDAETTVAYAFDMNPNVTGLAVGDITGVAKDGWDVSWTLNVRTEVTISGVTYPTVKPKFVYIERVKGRIDFGGVFGFG